MAYRQFEKLKSFRRVSPLLQVRKTARRVCQMFLACSIGILLLPWQQTSVGYGHVVAFSPNERPQVVSAPVDGLVLRWDVQEGSFVEKGENLVEMRDNDPLFLERLKAQLKAVENQDQSLKVAVSRSRSNLVRQNSLYASGISSQREYELAQIETSKLEKELADVELKLNELSSKVSQQAMQLVQAPITGTVARILAVPGSQIVKKGDPVAIIVPDSNNRAVEIWVDGNDLPLVRKGQSVRLEFEGWPAVQLVSGAPQIATGTFKAQVSVIEALGAIDGRFRVIATPEPGENWPSPKELLQGVRVRSWILLNRVSVGYELWRRFNGFPNLRVNSETEGRKQYFAPTNTGFIPLGKPSEKDKRDEK